MTRFHAPSEWLVTRLAADAAELADKKLVRLTDYRDTRRDSRQKQAKRKAKQSPPCQIIDFVGSSRGG